MSRRFQVNLSFWGNVFWFLASLVIAFFIWFLSTTAADPFDERSFPGIQVQFEPGENLVVTDVSEETVTVRVRTQQSAFSQLRTVQIQVRANLSGLPPGTHTVPLTAWIEQNGDVPNNYVARPVPGQVTFVLETIESQQKPVSIRVVEEPPVDLTYEEPTPEVRQAEVTGPATQIDRVVSVIGEIDLGEQRSQANLTVDLFPVDSEGERVPGVTISPATTQVNVAIVQRDGVRRVSISPRIRVESLPEGYMLSALSYEPQTIFVGGSPAQLASIEDTFFTERIDLSGQTDDFELTVPIELPYDDLLILSGQNTVTVSISIEAQTTVEQIDNVMVELIGLEEGYAVEITPETVSVVLNGPVAVLNDIEPADVQAVIDLNRLEPGNYEIAPTVLIGQGQVTVDSITLLPSTLDVVVRDVGAEAEATELPAP